MEKMGYLCKEEDPNNLRCKRLYLTELGERLNKDALKGIDEIDQKLFKGVSEEELETLVNIYDKLIINLAEIEKNETRLTKEELCEIVVKIKEKEENQND
jgi:DNA-binding MarR family transcriptional regulator